MTEIIRKQPSEPRDYRERFEFRFTVGNNIICQRYFRINNFNPISLSSFELAQTIRDCANIIDNDLKDKTEKYLYYSAPMIFNDAAEMNKYFENEANRDKMRVGHGIVLRDPNAPNYVWSAQGRPVVLEEKFDTGEFTTPITDEDRVNYKFAFYDDGREVCTTTWCGVYPKYVRNSIDLSNKKGNLTDGADSSKLSFDSYVLYKMVEGKGDIVYRIIKEICFTCSSQDNSWYTTTMSFKNKAGKIVKYDNQENVKELAKETRRLEKYLNEQTSR